MKRVLLVLLGGFALATSAYANTEEGEGLIKAKPIYVSMLPHFLVNLTNSDGQKFMQIKANTLVANKNTEEALKLYAGGSSRDTA